MAVTGKDALTLLDPATVPAAELPALALQLAALQTVVAARLVEVANYGQAEVSPSTEDELLNAAATAQLVNRSVSWLRHHGRTLPGYRQLRPGGRVGWSRQALVRWMSQGAC